jgi:hypothetical protein
MVEKAMEDACENESPLKKLITVFFVMDHVVERNFCIPVFSLSLQ